MWIMTTMGFFSVVQSARRLDGRDEVMVRARCEEDIAGFVASLDGAPWSTPLDRGPVIDTPRADYPFRVIVKREAFARWLAGEVMRLDYGNFKNEVAKTDPDRSHGPYMRVWSALRDGLDWREKRRKHFDDPFLAAVDHDVRHHIATPFSGSSQGAGFLFPEAAMGGPSMPETVKKKAKPAAKEKPVRDWRKRR